MRTQSSLLAFAFIATSTACGPPVDNSGGPPPDGTELDVEVLALGGTCGSFRDEAFIVRNDGASLDAFLAACPVAEGARGAWRDAVDALADDEVIVYANVTLGGCLGDFSVRGAFLDGTSLNAWVLREDTALGVPNAACTDDIGEGPASMIVRGASAATTATLTIGDFNPSLPGVPSLAR